MSETPVAPPLSVLDALDPANATKRHVLVCRNPTGDGTIEQTIGFDFQSFAVMARAGTPFMKIVGELGRYEQATKMQDEETKACKEAGTSTLESERFRIAQDELDRTDFFSIVAALALGGLNSRRHRKGNLLPIEAVYDLLNPASVIDDMKVLSAALFEAMPRQADVDAVGKSPGDVVAHADETPQQSLTTGGSETSNLPPSSVTT